MDKRIIVARFFESATGREPVREWLMKLPEQDRIAVGNDIRTAELGWPIGMPLCRSMKGQKGLWEIRSKLSGGRNLRVFFCVFDSEMILLHGIIKKSQKTPQSDINLAIKRMKGLKS